jgi:hypothetical protein
MSRDVTTLALVQPGTTLGGQTAGSAADANTYTLDGANITDDMSGNVTSYQTNFVGLGGAQTNGAPSGVIPTPIESIEEIKVNVANQTSDFGNSSGGQIQMATKRGTNTIHGSAYIYYFDTKVGAANNWQNNHTPETVNGVALGDTPIVSNHRTRYGGSLGGPIVPKNFLGGKWYAFFNYEALRFLYRNRAFGAVPGRHYPGAEYGWCVPGVQYQSVSGDSEWHHLPAGNLPCRRLRPARHRHELTSS